QHEKAHYHRRQLNRCMTASPIGQVKAGAHKKYWGHNIAKNAKHSQLKAPEHLPEGPAQMKIAEKEKNRYGKGSYNHHLCPHKAAFLLIFLPGCVPLCP